MVLAGPLEVCGSLRERLGSAVLPIDCNRPFEHVPDTAEFMDMRGNLGKRLHGCDGRSQGVVARLDLPQRDLHDDIIAKLRHVLRLCNGAAKEQGDTQTNRISGAFSKKRIIHRRFPAQGGLAHSADEQTGPILVRNKEAKRRACRIWIRLQIRARLSKSQTAPPSAQKNLYLDPRLTSTPNAGQLELTRPIR